jgi:hypothetical protein
MKRAVTIDGEAIIQARLRGYSVRSIAKHTGCSVADVNDVLDRFAAATITEKLRTHTLALELERLDGIMRVFEQRAREGDLGAAALITKIIERRCIMLGLAAPPRADPQIIELQAKPAETSTQRLRAAIDRIRSLPKPDGEPN